MAQEKTCLALNGTVISFPSQCIILHEQSQTDTEVFSFNQFVSLEMKEWTDSGISGMVYSLLASWSQSLQVWGVGLAI